MMESGTMVRKMVLGYKKLEKDMSTRENGKMICKTGKGQDQLEKFVIKMRRIYINIDGTSYDKNWKHYMQNV